VLIVDAETTSLTPEYEGGSGVIWELAIQNRSTGAKFLWRMKPVTDIADPEALEVGRYWERTRSMRHAKPEEIRARYGPHADRDAPLMDVWNLAVQTRYQCWSNAADLACVLPGILADATIVAAVPSFDGRFLSAFLAHFGQPEQPWHYRVRCIQSIAYGYLCSSDNPGYGRPPIDASTDTLAEALGVDPNGFERHTADGDVAMAVAMLDVIEGAR
jgi:hypothetical protein